MKSININKAEVVEILSSINSSAYDIHPSIRQRLEECASGSNHIKPLSLVTHNFTTHEKFESYLRSGGKMSKREWNLSGRPPHDNYDDVLKAREHAAFISSIRRSDARNNKPISVCGIKYHV